MAVVMAVLARFVTISRVAVFVAEMSEWMDVLRLFVAVTAKFVAVVMAVLAKLVAMPNVVVLVAETSVNLARPFVEVDKSPDVTYPNPELFVNPDPLPVN